jgi:hypothetical protein
MEARMHNELDWDAWNNQLGEMDTIVHRFLQEYRMHPEWTDRTNQLSELYIIETALDRFRKSLRTSEEWDYVQPPSKPSQKRIWIMGADDPLPLGSYSLAGAVVQERSFEGDDLYPILKYLYTKVCKTREAVEKETHLAYQMCRIKDDGWKHIKSLGMSVFIGTQDNHRNLLREIVRVCDAHDVTYCLELVVD